MRSDETIESLKEQIISLEKLRAEITTTSLIEFIDHKLASLKVKLRVERMKIKS